MCMVHIGAKLERKNAKGRKTKTHVGRNNRQLIVWSRGGGGGG